MSPPLLGVEGDETGSISLMTSTSSTESIYQNSPELMERNYLGLQDCSSVDGSDVSKLSEVNKNNLNLKATELRLGLPGSQSPEKTLFLLLPSKDGICLSSQRTVISGNKRGLLDTHERSHATNGTGLIKANGSNPHAAKAQVVGWPPVRTFHKNIVATSSRNNNEADEKTGPSAMFIKVSMDGAPYLRKVDLRSYSTYQQLSSALEKMFSCFTIDQCGSQAASGRERLSESKLRDLLNGSEYVVTYEDKDGDWMLVGDVPWDMFIGSCKRLKIMKGCDAIGLAPRSK